MEYLKGKGVIFLETYMDFMLYRLYSAVVEPNGFGSTINVQALIMMTSKKQAKFFYPLLRVVKMEAEVAEES